jgi:hypothetical protein
LPSPPWLFGWHVNRPIIESFPAVEDPAARRA